MYVSSFSHLGSRLDVFHPSFLLLLGNVKALQLGVEDGVHGFHGLTRFGRGRTLKNDGQNGKILTP